MELIPDSRKSGVYDSEHPLTLEFKSPKGIISLHSKLEVGLNAVVILSNSSQALEIYATDMDIRDAADLMKRYLSINKQQIVVGRLVLVTPIPNTNCVSIALALPSDTGTEEFVVGYMGVDPYHPREVKPAQLSTGPRQSDSGAPLVVVSDNTPHSIAN